MLLTDPEQAKGILVGSENLELFSISADHADTWLLFVEREIYVNIYLSIIIIVVISISIINLVIDTKQRIVS